jgi:hypothetical protein
MHMMTNDTPAIDRLRSALAASSYEHRARTVVHRWYSGYEAPHMNLGHQGELITDNFTMHRPPECGLPSVQGRQAYLGKDWRSCHHPQSSGHTGNRPMTWSYSTCASSIASRE